MLIALMMGMVLMAGVTGLLLRQLMGRKLGAAESYQQMAETAALNGFNRILSELNNDDNTAYKGYLFTLDHHGGDIDSSGSEKWGWNASNQDDFPLRELCTNRSQLPEAVPASSSTGEPPHVALTESTSSQRDDGKANIQLQYRLRGYTTTATASNNGAGEGRFQIEGLVVRDGDDPGKGYLARTLLLRSLYVNSIVAGEGDWAVLAGQTLSLGDTEILDRNGNTGEGKVLLNVNSADRYLTANGCLPSNLLEDVGVSNTNDNLKNRVIPILEKGLPTSNLWNLGLTQDQASDSDKVRIWSFDDTDSLEDCDAIVCSRDSDSANAEERDDLEEDGGSVIRLSSSELCKGTGDDCHIFVEHINLTSTRLLIETSANRPVVLHLEYPGTSTVPPSEPGITGSINLGSGAQLCGVDASSDICNGKPEQLIILSAAPKPSGVRSCGVSPVSDKYVLAFEGDSLPAASVHLIPGIVKTGTSRTSLNGLIWADGICTDAGPFTLVSGTSGDSTVVRDLNEQWDWESQNFPGYGQMVTRGIRGTGLDTFRRW
ncbi:putative conserved membrane protein [Synechococcus sp. MEDNS5]|nr:putative conserved membrane protein [Synechococcus sp. MEDNS5]